MAIAYAVANSARKKHENGEYSVIIYPSIVWFAGKMPREYANEFALQKCIEHLSDDVYSSHKVSLCEIPPRCHVEMVDESGVGESWQEAFAGHELYP